MGILRGLETPQSIPDHPRPVHTCLPEGHQRRLVLGQSALVPSQSDPVLTRRRLVFGQRNLVLSQSGVKMRPIQAESGHGRPTKAQRAVMAGLNMARIGHIPARMEDSWPSHACWRQIHAWSTVRLTHLNAESRISSGFPPMACPRQILGFRITFACIGAHLLTQSVCVPAPIPGFPRHSFARFARYGCYTRCAMPNGILPNQGLTLGMPVVESPVSVSHWGPTIRSPCLFWLLANSTGGN
jgi:hypothetical protein